MLFKEVVLVDTENHGTPSVQNPKSLIVKVAGYHFGLEG
jgi:hypothetical protein